jgi:sulfite reductase (NADPH) hemoprotein beta-component
VDIFAQDLGFIAIEKEGKLAGFNVTAGGGMGMSHGEAETYPRVADVIGFCTPEQVIAVAEAVVTIQRDNGDRSNRKHARLKYTIDDRGLDWFKDELRGRLGYELQAAAPIRFESRGDSFGWVEDRNKEWHLTLFVPQGRLKDDGQHRFLSGMREIAKRHAGEFRLTANQNLIISKISAQQRPGIEALLDEYGIKVLQQVSPLRQQALACVAFPTCALAMAEAERWLPELTQKTEALLAQHGLADEAISLRITGCPNGCARPYLAEIALVGKAPGRYNLYLGGDAWGRRLNQLVLENADDSSLFATLQQWFDRFARERQVGETFGDFVNDRLPKAGGKV